MTKLLDELDEIVKDNLEILPKPLPEILDEIATKLESLENAARKAELAAKHSGHLTLLAAKAYEQAEKIIIEAGEAAQKASEKDTKAATAAAAKAKETARAARKAEKVSSEATKAYKEVLLRVESLEKRLNILEEAAHNEEVVVIREITREEAKSEIERLFAQGKTLYYSDIAKELRLDLELVVDICEELVKEGKVGIAYDSRKSGRRYPGR